MLSARMTATFVLAALATVAASHRSLAADGVNPPSPYFDQIELFKAGDAGYKTYRIPAIAVTRRGTVLATCAARFDSHSDFANIDTMLRRSTDGGETWTEQQVITNDGLNAVDNATFIIDPASDRVYLMYQVNYARAYLKVSDDEGVTWSPPRDITDAFEVFRQRDGYNWRAIAMGPGHGITLDSGRMVVPVWLSTQSPRCRPSVSATIYSDDRGQTWRAGDIMVHTTDRTPNPSEHALVQLADGRVMSNIRSESPTYRRLISYSDDGASAWSEPEFHEDLFDPICMGSMVAWQSASDPGAAGILFSNADSRGAPEAGTSFKGLERRNVSVRLSLDGGATWPVSRVVEPGPSGYSDLAVLGDGTVLLFYERSGVDGHGAFLPGSLTLARFNMAWLTGAPAPEH